MTQRQSHHSAERYKKKKNPHLPGAMLPVLLAFLALTLLAWDLPIRPSESEEERRSLTPFPQCTLSTLLDGSFFDDINLWFSDTFPLRQEWIRLASGVKSLQGRSDVMIYGDLGQSDPIPAIPAPVTEDTQLEAPPTEAPTEAPTEEKAGTPTEALTEAPAEGPAGTPTEASTEGPAEEPTDPPTAEPADPPTEAPTDPPTEAPTEPEWKGVVLKDDDYFASDAVIQINNAAYNVPGFSEYYAGVLAESLKRGADILEGKAEFSLVLAPSNITFSLSRSDREFMGLVLQEDGLKYQESITDPRVHFVKVYDKLLEHSGEYLAFRTDHHWTALAAYYAYEAWCEERGIQPVPLSDYKEVVFEGYLGTTYYKARRSSLINPDTIYAYEPPGDVHLYIGEGEGLGLEYPLLADESQANASVKYGTFLRGDQPKCVFVNNDITDGSACLILKNSMGNPFAYYFTQHYQYTYVLDLRYYWTYRMTGFTTRHPVQDVIICVGADFGWGKGGNELIGSFCR